MALYSNQIEKASELYVRANISDEEKYQLLMEALLYARVLFVDFLLSTNFPDLSNFLTIGRLKDLYTASIRKNVVENFLRKLVQTGETLRYQWPFSIRLRANLPELTSSFVQSTSVSGASDPFIKDLCTIERSLTGIDRKADTLRGYAPRQHGSVRKSINLSNPNAPRYLHSSDILATTNDFFLQPFRELLIWSIIIDQPRLTMTFLRHKQESGLQDRLMCATMLNKYAKINTSHDELRLEEVKDELLADSVEILNYARISKGRKRNMVRVGGSNENVHIWLLLFHYSIYWLDIIANI